MRSLSSDAPGTEGPWLLYDGACFFCSAYVRMAPFQNRTRPLRLVDSRENGPELAEARAAGYDINDGMVLKYDGLLHAGADCVHILSMLSAPKEVLNRLIIWAFRSERRSKLLYPALKRGGSLASAPFRKKRNAGVDADIRSAA